LKYTVKNRKEDEGRMKKPSKEARDATELLHEVFMAHKRTFHALAKEHGLSPQQASTLLNLVPGVGMPMNGIADFLMCDASNVTGIVDKLEARGLARRGQGEDRRVKALTLTPEGEALRASLREILHAPPSWLLALSREDQRTLVDILQRAHESLRGEKL
jgi:DNA-binding MarR family transcriptional regulator